MLTNYKTQGFGYAEFLLEVGLPEESYLKNMLLGKAFTKDSS